MRTPPSSRCLPAASTTRGALAVCVAASLVLLAAPAIGGSGVTELNQAIALAGGPGDAPGFPLYILSPGNYQLTSDLVVTGGITDPPEASTSCPPLRG